MNQSIGRACSILETLAEESIGVDGVAERLGVHHTTAWRFLKTLEQYGLVERSASDGLYRLGTGLLPLAASVLDRLDVRSIARPWLEGLAATTGETVHLAVRHKDRAIYIDKIPSIHSVQMNSSIGQTLPLFATALGKALLAYTPMNEWPSLTLTRFTDSTITDMDILRRECDEARVRGYAVDRGEEESSIWCVASGIAGFLGECVAAVSISIPYMRLEDEEAKICEFGKLVVGTAEKIGAMLGGPAD